MSTTAPLERQTRRLPTPSLPPLRVLRPLRRPDPTRNVRLVVGGLAAAAIGLYVVLALLRIAHPFELEWMEGGVVDHVRRVLAGQPLYGRPTLGFTPYIYPPLYYYVCAPVAWLLGVGLFPLRLVSFLSSLVAMAAIFGLVRRETGDRWAALVAAGVFAACYRAGGAWFDLARVDSLFLALLFGGILVTRRARSWRGVLTGALLLAASFLTKQAALVPALALAPFLLRRRSWRWAALHVGTVLGVIGASTVVFDHLSHGWYSKFVFDLPAQHAMVHSLIVSFWTRDLLGVVAPAAVLGAAGLALLWRGRRTAEGADALWFHVPLAIGLVMAAYTARLHSGGYDNVLLPAYGGVAILLGLALPALAAEGRGYDALLHTERLLRPLVYALALLQLVVLVYNPLAQVPRARDARAGRRVLAELRALPGSVLLTGHGWYLARAGKVDTAQGAAIKDVLRGGLAVRHQLAAELEAVIRSQRYDEVIVDSSTVFSYLPNDFARYYRRDHRLLGRHGLYPVTGTRTRPQWVYVPRLQPRSE